MFDHDVPVALFEHSNISAGELMFSNLWMTTPIPPEGLSRNGNVLTFGRDVQETLVLLRRWAFRDFKYIIYYRQVLYSCDGIDRIFVCLCHLMTEVR